MPRMSARADVDAAVLVAGVQPLPATEWSLKPSASIAADVERVEVEHGDGVVLLQRDPGRRPSRGDRDVLGLEVERRQRRAETRTPAGSSPARGAPGSKAPKPMVCTGQRLRAAGSTTLTDPGGSTWPGRYPLGLALVGDEDPPPVRGERHHVGPAPTATAAGSCRQARTRRPRQG